MHRNTDKTKSRWTSECGKRKYNDVKSIRESPLSKLKFQTV